MVEAGKGDVAMAKDFTSETGRAAGEKGKRTQRMIRDVQKITKHILYTRFDASKLDGVKDALDSINYYEGRDEDERKTLCLSALIAYHTAMGFGDINSARFVFELAGMTPGSKKVCTEVKKLELEVKKLQMEIDAQQGGDDEPEVGPEVSDEEIEASLRRSGVTG